MAFDLVPEALYHPFGGMNPDSNGVTARPDEAVDIVNLNVSSSACSSRSGTHVLDEPTIANDCTLTGGEDGGNYTYDHVSVSEEGYHNFTHSNAGNVANIIFDSQRSRWAVWQVLPGPTTLLYYNDAQSIFPPMTGWTRAMDDSPSALVITATLEGQFPSAVITYHEYVHPEDGLQVFAFGSNYIYRYDGDGVWTDCVDAGVTITLLEQWSITNYIDREIGATIAAAGSKYTRPIESYVNGSDRILVYYDPDSQTFKTLQMYSDELAEEYFNLGNLPVPYIFTGTLTNGRIIAGNTYFTLEGTGLVGLTSLITNTNDTGELWQFIISPGQSTPSIIEGGNSFINLTTGAFSVEFDSSPTNNSNLTILYSHRVEADFKPLHIANFHNALVFANTYEPLSTGRHYYGWRVRWTQPNDMDTLLQRDYQELALSDITPILAMKPLETSASSTIVGPLYFYKHNSIVRGTYNQNYGLDASLPVPLFEFELAYSEGIEATNTIVAANGVHFFLGRNDVYIFNGYERRSITHDEQTGNTKIQSVLFQRLNLDSLNRCFGLYDETNRQYFLFFTEYAKGVHPEQAAVYDIDNNTWKRMTLPPTSAAINVDIAPNGIIAKLPGQIQNLEGTIEDLTGNQSKLILLAMPDMTYYVSGPGSPDRGGVYNDPIVSYFVTRDFFGQTLEENDRMEKVIVEAIGDSIDIGWNGDYSYYPDDFKQVDTLTFSGTKYRRESYHCDAVTTAIRFIVYLNGVTQFRWLQAFSKKQEFSNE